MRAAMIESARDRIFTRVMDFARFERNLMRPAELSPEFGVNCCCCGIADLLIVDGGMLMHSRLCSGDVGFRI